MAGRQVRPQASRPRCRNPRRPRLGVERQGRDGDHALSLLCARRHRRRRRLRDRGRQRAQVVPRSPRPRRRPDRRGLRRGVRVHGRAHRQLDQLVRLPGRLHPVGHHPGRRRGRRFLLPQVAARGLDAPRLEGSGQGRGSEAAPERGGLQLLPDGRDPAVLAHVRDDDHGRDRRPDGGGAAQPHGRRLQGRQDAGEHPLAHHAGAAVRTLGGPAGEHGEVAAGTVHPERSAGPSGAGSPTTSAGRRR